MSDFAIMSPHTFTDDINILLAKLPGPLQEALRQQDDLTSLLEVVMDFGRRPQARYTDRAIDLREQPITRDELAAVTKAVGEFGDDNRAGIEGTLHRISAIRNRKGVIIGLTLRVGRAVTGTVESIRDLVQSGSSLLLLGRPGVGKTTKLREVARILADDMNKRVVVIDTSNEIAGDGDIPHPAIGGARRMQVPATRRQAAVMIEAVENHMPEAIVIDEIGNEAEATAARTIAERGVQLVGTAHGNTLENLVQNPSLADLVGGVQTVTLSDEEARMRGTQKTISERKAPPTFEVVVELVDRDRVIVHPDTARAVDRILRGAPAGGEARGLVARQPTERRRPVAREEPALTEAKHTARIHAHALSPDLVQRVIRELQLDARTVRTPDQADIIISLRSRADDRQIQTAAEDYQIPIYEVKKNAGPPIRRLLQKLFMLVPAADKEELQAAVQEVADAIDLIHREGGEVALAPQPAHLRRVQHELVLRNELLAESVGSEPQRHLVVHD